MNIKLDEQWRYPSSTGEAHFQTNQAYESSTKKKVEMLNSSLWARIKVIGTSSKAIKPTLKYISMKIAGGITFGHTSKMFKVNAVHSFFHYTKIWSQFYFGDDSIGSARNIGKKRIWRLKKMRKLPKN